MDLNKILPQGLQVPNRQNQMHLIKSGVLALLAVLSFAVTWQLLGEGFQNSLNLAFWVWPSLSAALAVTFLALLNVANRTKWLVWVTPVLILAIYLLIMPKNLLVALGGVLFFLLCLWFERRIKHDETARIDFLFSRVMRDSLTIMVYALLLVIGFNVYVKAQESLQKNPQQLYNRIGNYAVQGLQYVPSNLGDFNPDQRFDEFVLKQAERQDPGFAQAPVAQKEILADQVKSALEQKFNLKISGNPLLSDVVAGWVSEKVHSAASSYQNSFPLIFAVIVAVLLRGLAFVFVWLTIFVSWLVFKLLLAVKFFKIEKVQVEVDKLQI